MITKLDHNTISGTNAERLGMTVSPDNFVIFYETDTNAQYEWKGIKWVQTATNGAANVFQPDAPFSNRGDKYQIGKSNERWKLQRIVATNAIAQYDVGDFIGQPVTIKAIRFEAQANLTQALIQDGSSLQSTLIKTYAAATAVGTELDFRAARFDNGFSVTMGGVAGANDTLWVWWWPNYDVK